MSMILILETKLDVILILETKLEWLTCREVLVNRTIMDFQEEKWGKITGVLDRNGSNNLTGWNIV